MASIGKKLHHYVPRFYIKAWAQDDLVYCLRNGKILHTNVRNVAAENYFYRLCELSARDIAFVREVAIADSPKTLKPYLERLLRVLSLPHVARRKVEASAMATPELLAGVDNLITEMKREHAYVNRGRVQTVSKCHARWRSWLLCAACTCRWIFLGNCGSVFANQPDQESPR